METIASNIPDANTLFSLLEVLKDDPAYEKLQVFNKLAITMEKEDLWPDLHIHNLDHIPELKIASTFVKKVYFHEIYDMDAMEAILHPTNELILENLPNNDYFESISINEWFTRLSKLPLIQCTSGDCDSLNIDILIEFLPFMNQLKHFELNYLKLNNLNELFHGISNSKLTHLILADMEMENDTKPSLDNYSISQLTKWLVNQPVENLTLTHWNINADQSIVNQFYDALWSCKTLDCINFFTTIFPSFGFDHSILPYTFTSMNLGDCGLVDENAIALATRLRNSNLKKLNLKLNQFSPIGIDAIFDALKETNIQDLNLVCSGIEMNHINAMANHLNETKLKSLDLYDNKINSDGLNGFMAAVAKSQLTHLNLSYTGLDNTSIHLLSTYLPMTKLEIILLDFNNITDTGAKILADTIPFCPHLTTISIGENQLTIDGIQSFLPVLSGRMKTRLNFTENNFDIEKISEILSDFNLSQGHEIVYDQGVRDFWFDFTN